MVVAGVKYDLCYRSTEDHHSCIHDDVYSDGSVSDRLHGRLPGDIDLNAHVEHHQRRSAMLAKQDMPSPASKDTQHSTASRQNHWQARERAFWEDAEGLEATQKKQEHIDAFRQSHRLWQDYYVSLQDDIIATAPNKLARQNIPLHRKLSSLSDKKQSWALKVANIDPRIKNRLGEIERVRQSMLRPPNLMDLKDYWVHRVADPNQRIIQTLQGKDQARYNIPGHRKASIRGRKDNSPARSYRITPKKQDNKSSIQKLQEQHDNLQQSLKIIEEIQRQQRSQNRTLKKHIKDREGFLKQQQHQSLTGRVEEVTGEDIQDRTTQDRSAGSSSSLDKADEHQRDTLSHAGTQTIFLEKAETPRKRCIPKISCFPKFRYRRRRQRRAEPRSRITARSEQGLLFLQGISTNKKNTSPHHQSSAPLASVPSRPRHLERQSSAPFLTSASRQKKISSYPPLKVNLPSRSASTSRDSLIPYRANTQTETASQTGRHGPVRTENRKDSNRACPRGSGCLNGLLNQFGHPKSPGLFDILTNKSPPYDHHIILSYDNIWHRDPRHTSLLGITPKEHDEKASAPFPKNIPSLMAHAWSKTPQGPWDAHWSKDPGTLESQYSPPVSPPRLPKYASTNPNIPSTSKSVQRPEQPRPPKQAMRSKRMRQPKYLPPGLRIKYSASLP